MLNAIPPRPRGRPPKPAAWADELENAHIGWTFRTLQDAQTLRRIAAACRCPHERAAIEGELAAVELLHEAQQQAGPVYERWRAASRRQAA